MHMTVFVFGNKKIFANCFNINELSWDTLYNTISIYFDADYFDYIDEDANKQIVFDIINSNVIVMDSINTVDYCGCGRYYDKWDEVECLGSLDVHI